MTVPLLHTQLLWSSSTCKRTVSRCYIKELSLLNLVHASNMFLVCAIGGYMHYQGYDISPAQALIPKLQGLLQAFRSAGFPVYHTREGKLVSSYFQATP